MKPARGGTPAILNIIKATVIARRGLVLDNVRNCKIPFKDPREFCVKIVFCRGTRDC